MFSADSRPVSQWVAGRKLFISISPTFLNVLVLIEGNESVVLAETSEGVYEMSAEVRVDVLRGELGVPLSVDGPVCVVTDHLPVLDIVP